MPPKNIYFSVWHTRRYMLSSSHNCTQCFVRSVRFFVCVCVCWYNKHSTDSTNTTVSPMLLPPPISRSTTHYPPTMQHSTKRAAKPLPPRAIIINQFIGTSAPCSNTTAITVHHWRPFCFSLSLFRSRSLYAEYFTPSLALSLVPSVSNSRFFLLPFLCMCVCFACVRGYVA